MPYRSQAGGANPRDGITCQQQFARYTGEDTMTLAPTLYGKSHQPREIGRKSLGPLRGGDLCLDFINTVEDHDQPGGFDSFAPGYVNVIEWFTHAGAMGEDQASQLLRHAAEEPREAASVRSRATALRRALYEIVSSLTSGVEPPGESMATCNEEWRHALDSGRYVPGGDGITWQWNEGNQLDRVVWVVTHSAVDLFSSPRMAKVRQCAAPNCQRFFLDGSKNGSRHFCSAATCGTAERVRRFRDRQRSAT